MPTHVTTIWRFLLAGLLFLSVPLAIVGYERFNRVDTERMLDASVSIRTTSQVHTDHVGDSVWEAGQGSGFLVSSEDCEIWTNHHVVNGAALVEVYPRGWRHGDGIPAEVVASTPRADFAILRIAHCDGMAAAPLGDRTAAQVGDPIYAVGNPLGKNPDTITRGILSHTERYIQGATAYLQTDASINPGNSGGALYNAGGEVIGISTAIASIKGVNSGIGYAVPIDLLKEEARRLRGGAARFGDAGISDSIGDLTPEQASLLRVPDGFAAIVLLDAPEEGPSQGLLQPHDVIYAIAGQPVRDASHAKGIINDHDPGDSLRFDLVRAGALHSVFVVLADGHRPEDAVTPQAYDGLLGMTLEMWNGLDDERSMFDTPVITQVQGLGPAHRAKIMSSQKTLIYGVSGLRPHMLDVKTVTGVAIDGVYAPVTTVAQIEDAASRAHASGQAILLEVAMWARSNPMNRNAELAHMETRFFTLEPRHSAFGSDTTSGASIVSAAVVLP